MEARLRKMVVRRRAEAAILAPVGACKPFTTLSFPKSLSLLCHSRPRLTCFTGSLASADTLHKLCVQENEPDFGRRLAFPFRQDLRRIPAINNRYIRMIAFAAPWHASSTSIMGMRRG